MKLDVGVVHVAMLRAARTEIGDLWPSARALAEAEFGRLAKSMADVDELVRNGDIDANRARTLIHIHEVAARTVLATVEGLGLAGAEKVTRAATRVVGDAVNRVIGFPLL